MKKTVLLLAIIILHQYAFAQNNVGIGTVNPNASAALDISSTNKGLLIPRVALQSTIDASTIPSPATGLLVYNTNVVMAAGTGYYFNNGTAASPAWTKINDLTLPYYKATTAPIPAFNIENYSLSSTSTAVRGFSQGGTGVSAYSALGNALETNGKVKIAGGGQAPSQGKVLTSDANGNATWEGAIAFYATGIKAGGSAVIPPNTVVKLAFGSEMYDIGNDYNNSEASPHSTFIAPVHGIYHFDGKVTWLSNDISGSAVSLSLKVLNNGNTTVINEMISNFPDQFYLTQQFSTDVELQAGAQVFVTVDHNVSGTNVSLQTAARYAHFNGMLKIKL